MICPTVTIETKNGPVDINESDFDSKIHKLFSDKKPIVLDTKLQKKRKSKK